MATKETKRLVRIDPNLAAKIGAAASIEGVPAYDVLERAAREYLTRRHPALMRPVARPKTRRASPHGLGTSPG